VFWQVGGPGPFFGQLLAFEHHVPRNDEAIDKFRAESKRLVMVLDHHLDGREWIAAAYSIADIINYPWFASLNKNAPDAFEGAEAVKAWMARMAARPAVQKGMAI
jgi:GST-like protein